MWHVAGDGGTVELWHEMLATASHGCLNRARHELQGVATVLPKQREEDEKASVEVGRVELQLRREPVMAGGGGNGQCALTKTQTAQLRGGGCRGGHGRAIDELAVAFLRRSSELGDGRAARQWRSGAARGGR